MNWDLVWTWPNLQRLAVGNFPSGEPGGLLVTLSLAALAIVASTVLGAVFGILRASPRRPARWAAAAYIELFRNVPLLLLIFWAYFVPPYLGLPLSKFWSVALALVVFTGAYIAEVVRSGLLAVPAGTIEAARVLGLGRLQVELWVRLPIAFKAMVPALTGRYITVVKNTSLAFLIGLTDVTDVARDINNRLLVAPIEVYLTLLVIYFVVNTAITRIGLRLEDERRFNRLFVRL